MPSAQRSFMFVDGSNQRTTRPGIYQQYFYNGHKRCHCVKWQGLMLPNGIMPFPFGPINGHRADEVMSPRNLVHGMAIVSRGACKRNLSVGRYKILENDF